MSHDLRAQQRTAWHVEHAMEQILCLKIRRFQRCSGANMLYSKRRHSRSAYPAFNTVLALWAVASCRCVYMVIQPAPRIVLPPQACCQPSCCYCSCFTPSAVTFCDKHPSSNSSGLLLPELLVPGGGGFIPARILRTFLKQEHGKTIPIQVCTPKQSS
jgi:hypothetical protein